MFDSYHVHKQEIVPIATSVTVKEIKAPTDASVKLYEEIKQKAYDSILFSVMPEENLMKAKVQYYKDWVSDSECVMWLINLNGKPYQGKFQTQERFLNKFDLMRAAYEDISKVLAAQLISELKPQ
jgi:hypothetical protein